MGPTVFNSQDPDECYRPVEQRGVADEIEDDQVREKVKEELDVLGPCASLVCSLLAATMSVLHQLALHRGEQRPPEIERELFAVFFLTTVVTANFGAPRIFFSKVDLRN